MTPSIYSLFVLGAILTCIITPIIRHLAFQKGFVDCPQRARKVHQQATPRLGGAAILLSFLVVIAIAGLTVPQLSELLWGNNPVIGSVILGSIGIFFIGFLDDLARLSPKTKLLAEFYESTNIASIDTESLIETNEERQLLADIHTKELHIDDPIKLINECLRTLKKNTLNQKKTLLTQKIQQTDSNDVKFIELMKKVKQINQELIETQNLAIQ